MRLPSLTALTMFEATARLGSFARAADELCVTESAVCRQVVSLEERMKVQFFKRSKKRLVLTTDGARYAQEVRGCIDNLSFATEAVVNRAARRDVVEIGTVPAFATHWLVPRLGDFLAANERVQLNVFARVDPLDFAASKFDFLIYSGSNPLPGFPFCKVTSEGDSVVVCNRVRASQIGFGDWNALVTTGLLHLESRPEAWSKFLSERGHVRGEAALGHRLELFSMVIQAAIAGWGVALVPRIMAEGALNSGELVELAWCREEFEMRDDACTYFASWKPGCSDSVIRLAEWLRRLDGHVAPSHAMGSVA